MSPWSYATAPEVVGSILGLLIMLHLCRPTPAPTLLWAKGDIVSYFSTIENELYYPQDSFCCFFQLFICNYFIIWVQLYVHLSLRKDFYDYHIKLIISFKKSGISISEMLKKLTRTIFSSRYSPFIYFKGFKIKIPSYLLIFAN